VDSLSLCRHQSSVRVGLENVPFLFHLGRCFGMPHEDGLVIPLLYKVEEKITFINRLKAVDIVLDVHL